MAAPSCVSLRGSRFLNVVSSQRSLFNIGESRGFLNRRQPECVVKPCTELNEGLLDAEKLKPAVLVLGFGNSSERHRVKYAEAYTRLGIPAMHYNANCYWEGIPTAEDTQPFAPLFGGADAGDLEPFVDRPFFIHCLSQNGSLGLCRLYRYLELNKKEHIWKENCKGILFDCGPGRLTSAIHAFAYVSTRPHETQEAISEAIKPTFAKEMLLFLPMLAWNMRMRAVQYLAPERLSDYTPFDYIKLKIDFPQTVFWFYSKSDNLIEPKDTEELIEHVVAGGKDVTIWSPEAAPHIFHVTRWKQRYVDFCQHFGRTVYARYYNNDELLSDESMPSAPERLKKSSGELDAAREAEGAI